MVKETFGVGATILAYETVSANAVRHVKISSMHVIDAGHHQALITTRVLNDGQTYVRPQVHLLVAQGPRVVIDRDDSTPVVFAGNVRVLNQTLRDLAPGSYNAQITLDYGGEAVIRATTHFVVQ